MPSLSPMARQPCPAWSACSIWRTLTINKRSSCPRVAVRMPGISPRDGRHFFVNCSNAQSFGGDRRESAYAGAKRPVCRQPDAQGCACSLRRDALARPWRRSVPVRVPVGARRVCREMSRPSSATRMKAISPGSPRSTSLALTRERG